VPLHPADNAYDLFMRSSEVLVDAVAKVIDKIAAGEADLEAQDARTASFFGPGVPFSGWIDWSQPAERVAAFVRAMDFGRFNDCGTYQHLKPPAQASIAGQSLAIWRASAAGRRCPSAPGTIARCDEQVWVQTGRGHLVLEKVCDAAGGDHDAARYFAHQPFRVGDCFDTDHVWSDAMTLRRAA